MQPAAPSATRDVPPPNPAASPSGDLAYETFYGAAIGGATIALFFLLIDSVGGRPLYTPSLMGTALFTDLPAGEATPVRHDMVALYSVFHFGSFLLLGAAASKLRDRIGAMGVPRSAMIGVLFVLLTAVFAAGNVYPLTGVGSAIGWHWILGANLVTAVVMSLFLDRARAAD